MQTKEKQNKNFAKPLSRFQDNVPQKNMKDKEELHLMLHKLKKYYNELNKLRVSKTENLTELKSKHIDLTKQIEDKQAFSDIEFPYEKISIQDYEQFKDSKETKDSIREKIENLSIHRNQLLLKYKTEIEFGNTINNLIRVEKKNLEDIHENVLQTQDKINTLKIAHKNLESNKEENEKKEKIIKKVKNELDSELLKLRDVIGFQNKNYDCMIGDLENKNNFNQKFKREIELKNVQLDNQHKKSSDKILSELQKTKMIKSTNTKKESYIIKLILGLDIIKKYFIQVDFQGKEIITSDIIKTDDYKTFMSEKFSIQENESTFSQNDIKNSQSAMEDEKINLKTNISLKNLREKLQNIDLDYDKIYNFYTKIINKTNFYHNHMINFNFKQISLETKKESYTKRVKEIIEKNYKSLEDLKKFDEKFDVLIKKFQHEIKVTNVYDNLKDKIKDFDPKPSIYTDFYDKCRNYLSDIKTFNQYILFKFKRIKNECDDLEIKKSLGNNYKMIKEIVKNENDANKIDKYEFIKDVFKTVEMDYMKENKKLEKILNAIVEYSSNNINNDDYNNNESELGLNINDIEEINFEKNNFTKIKNQNIKTLMNEERNMNDIIKEINKENVEEKNNFTENLEKIKKLSNNKLKVHKQTTLRSQRTDFTKINNQEVISEINKNKINEIENNLPCHLSGTEIFQSNNATSNLFEKKISNFPYISPFSDWSLVKLEEERDLTLEKIQYLKYKIEAVKYFEDYFNLNNLMNLDIPFEKTIFYFFENADNLINIMLIFVKK